MVRSVFAILEDLQDQLYARGGKGIKGLGRVFRIMDDNGNRSLDREEFMEAMNDIGMDIPQEEFNVLYAALDRDGSGSIDFEEFLIGIRGKMNEFRTKLVRQAFDKLDKNGNGVIEINDIAGVYNAKKHPKVMEGKMTEGEALGAYLANFDGEDGDGVVTWAEFQEYYAGVSASVDDDAYFELMMFKAYDISPDAFNLGEVMNKIMQHTYKNRVRPKEFFVDFDKLRSGYITQGQFQTGMSMAGMTLTERNYKGLCDYYKDETTSRIHYKSFCEDMDQLFTLRGLEKVPLQSVPAEPSTLLNKTRFTQASVTLGGSAESRVQKILDRLRTHVSNRSVPVKGFFDDFSRNQNSPMRVNHVTCQQFSQVLSYMMGVSLRESELAVLLQKFDADGDGFINYVAFAKEIDLARV